MATYHGSAGVSAWVAATKQRTVAVFRESAQRVIAEGQRVRGEGGRMRIDTGFLRASLMASTSAMPSISRDAKPAAGGSYAYNSGAVSLVIAGAQLGQTIYAGYSASYAAAREYGARGQPPDGFVRGAAEKWQAIVAAVAREAQGRAAAR